MTPDQRRAWLRKVTDSLDGLHGCGGVVLLGKLVNIHAANIHRRLRGAARITDRDVSQIRDAVAAWHGTQADRHKAAAKFVKADRP